MSSSMKAIYDDAADWTEFCQNHNLPQEWKLYGQEYNLAYELYRIKGYTGKQLKLAIRHEQELNALRKRHSDEWNELTQLQKLEEKYA
jgi:hypothetical protein